MPVPPRPDVRVAKSVPSKAEPKLLREEMPPRRVACRIRLGRQTRPLVSAALLPVIAVAEVSSKRPSPPAGQVRLPLHDSHSTHKSAQLLPDMLGHAPPVGTVLLLLALRPPVLPALTRLARRLAAAQAPLSRPVGYRPPPPDAHGRRERPHSRPNAPVMVATRPSAANKILASTNALSHTP